MSHNKLVTDLIFVVDDQPDNRELASIYLKKLGWRTRECASCEQALQELSVIAPAAILLDIKMPGMDGISLAKLVRETLSRASTRIVGYTAHALKDEVQQIRDAGFDDVLIKPVTFASISSCFGIFGAALL